MLSLNQRSALLFVLAAGASCNDSHSSAEPSTGGSTSGGKSSLGGGATAGGSPGSGGTAALGGNPATGGVGNTGGGKSTGGAPATGGTAAGGSMAGGPAAGGTTSGGASGGAAGSGGTAGMSGGGSGGKAVNGRAFVYVSGSGPQISIFSLDVGSATLNDEGNAPAGDNPSYLAISDDHRYLYAVNERSKSRVIAFEIDPSNGALTEINRQDTNSDGAAHLAVHPSGKWVVVPHYNSGEVMVLPVRDDGGVNAASATTRGPDDDRCENAHQAVFDATGEHLFIPCLGSNYVLQFRFQQGELTLNTPPTAAVPGGPRHMALHPTLPYAYVLSELESELTRLAYDREQGLISAPTSVSSVESTPGSSAHIVVHPSGKFLYVSNRTENSIGLFAIDQSTGAAAPVAFERGMIATPRDFTIDPSGNLLLSANQATGDLLVFRIAPADGRLTRERTVSVGERPSFVGILRVP